MDEVTAEIQKHLETCYLSAKDGECLCGRLQFLDGQLFGKLAQCAYNAISRHVALGRGELSNHMCSQLSFVASHIQEGRPPWVTSHPGKTLFVYVDASHEPGDQLPARFGGILYDGTRRELSYFSEHVDRESLNRINRDDSGNPIFELECLAIFVAMKLWHTCVAGRHVIFFTDTAAASGAMVRGYADNPIGSTIVHVTHAILRTIDCIAWFERVS